MIVTGSIFLAKSAQRELAATLKQLEDSAFDIGASRNLRMVDGAQRLTEFCVVAAQLVSEYPLCGSGDELTRVKAYDLQVVQVY